MGPEDPAGARDGGRLRAGDADREHVIDTLKTAFTQGRLTGEDLDARTGHALAARTYAELNAVTTDIPGATRLDGPPPSPARARAGAAGPPALARRWPLARAAVKAGGCLVLAVVLAYSGNMIDNSDPNGIGAGPHHGWTRLLLVLTYALVVTGLVILARGVAAACAQRDARAQARSRPGPDGPRKTEAS